jgi:hypothetical protein
VYFGCHGFPNLVDDGVTHSRRIESTDIFNPQFWDRALLNSDKDMGKAFLDIVKNHLPTSVIDLDEENGHLE